MITTLIADVCVKLDLEDRLRTTQSEVKSIEATYRTLDQIAALARSLTGAVKICEPLLEDLTVESILAQMAAVAEDLEASRQRFATQRKEQLALHSPRTKLQRAAADLTAGWQSYAQKRLMPYLELLRLVNYLPEVAASAAEINQLVALVRAEMTEPPISVAQLNQFEQHLGELGRRLESVARLPDEVHTFLNKVVDGTATIADLTPQTRCWRRRFWIACCIMRPR